MTTEQPKPLTREEIEEWKETPDYYDNPSVSKREIEHLVFTCDYYLSENERLREEGLWTPITDDPSTFPPETMPVLLSGIYTNGNRWIVIGKIEKGEWSADNVPSYWRHMPDFPPRTVLNPSTTETDNEGATHV